jgi:hypothetical protein
MWMLEIPPFLPFFIAALLAGITRGTLRNVIIACRQRRPFMDGARRHSFTAGLF